MPLCRVCNKELQRKQPTMRQMRKEKVNYAKRVKNAPWGIFGRLAKGREDISKPKTHTPKDEVMKNPLSQKFNDFVKENDPTIVGVVWAMFWRLWIILFLITLVLSIFGSGKTENNNFIPQIRID